MYNCPLKGSEGSQVNIVTSHRQTSNGGWTAGLRRSKRLLEHDGDRDEDENRKPNYKRG